MSLKTRLNNLQRKSEKTFENIAQAYQINEQTLVECAALFIVKNDNLIITKKTESKFSHASKNVGPPLQRKRTTAVLRNRVENVDGEREE